MPESTFVCLTCQATLTLDPPDVLETPDGEELDAATMDQAMVAEALREYMHTQPCPSCGSRQMRLSLSDER